MAPELFQIVAIILCINVDPAYTYVRACFFKSDARLRTNEAAFSVKDIDFSLCTHYIYGYANISAQYMNIVAVNRNEEQGTSGLYRQFTSGKTHYPSIKTILSVGGEGKSHDVSFLGLRARDPSFYYFAGNAMKFLKGGGFDGLNIHWEMENADHGRYILPKLLKALRDTFNEDTSSTSLLLTMTGFGNPSVVRDKYIVWYISQYLDYVFVQSKDSVLSKTSSFIGPLYRNPKIEEQSYSVDESIQYWIQMGMRRSQIVMSVTALGHYCELAIPRYILAGNRLTGEMTGSVYKLYGRLAYPEICRMMKRAQTHYDDVQKNPYMATGLEWVGYTDAQSLRDRIRYIENNGLAGIEFTNLDEDDFSGTACNAGKFPLVTSIKRELAYSMDAWASTSESHMNTVGDSCFWNVMLMQLLCSLLELGAS